MALCKNGHVRSLSKRFQLFRSERSHHRLFPPAETAGAEEDKETDRVRGGDDVSPSVQVAADVSSGHHRVLLSSSVAQPVMFFGADHVFEAYYRRGDFYGLTLF